MGRHVVRPPDRYGYAVMLAAVLGGIAAGSYLVAPWLRRRPERDWFLALGVLEGGIAIASLLSLGARQALVIGLGGGATAGALSQHTGVAVDVVELSPKVAQAAARFFRPINFDVLRKPNVRLHIDDGRNYLLLTGKGRQMSPRSGGRITWIALSR